MKNVLCLVSLFSALLLSSFAEAREVTFTTNLKLYAGNPAYLAMYLVDEHGHYQRTLWVSGKHRKYYRELRGWAHASRLQPKEYDGLTGASITRGRTLKVSLNIDDQLIDHGNRIVIDTAVEDRGTNRSEVVMPFTTANTDQAVSGRGIINSFSYHL